MTAAVLQFREFELPWTPTEQERGRFRRVLLTVLTVFAAGGILVPLLPAVPPVVTPHELPRHVVELTLREPAAVPPPPAVQPAPVEAPRQPEREQQPVAQVGQARERAEKSGVLALKDELQQLREAADTSSFASPQSLAGAVTGPAATERALITARAPGGSGGINTAALSTGYRTGQASLRAHEAAAVPATGAVARAAAARPTPGYKPARSREEIELVFDRNKAAIYALYNRALRDNPGIKGKVVVQLSIAPSGEVTDCRMLSSELGDAELERKLVARISMFRFERRDVEPLTTTKPIEFFPA